MQARIEEKMLARAGELFAAGEVSCAVGWRRGVFGFDASPSLFSSFEEMKADFVYNEHCGGNLSKYLIELSRKGGKVLAFLKPCDTYSFNQLVKERRVARENVCIVGIPCLAFVAAPSGEGVAVPLQKCAACGGLAHAVFDELITEDCADARREAAEKSAERQPKRFAEVAAIEALTSDERFAFWKNELSRCIRCNACRAVCPACSCNLCVFDNPASGFAQKAAASFFEEEAFHIIRAFHVAGRYTDCGECSRACPQRIPLYLLNRKVIKDINALYGEFQAGADIDAPSPLGTYSADDAEPFAASAKEGL